jgi:hypothetical protein
MYWFFLIFEKISYLRLHQRRAKGANQVGVCFEGANATKKICEFCEHKPFYSISVSGAFRDIVTPYPQLE